MSRRVVLVVGLPLAAALLGGGAGWWASRSDEPAQPDDATVVDAVELAADAPARPLPARTDPAVIDISSVVGYPSPPTVVAPPRAAVELRVGPDGLPPVVDAVTGDPVAPPTPLRLPPVEPAPATGLRPPSAPPVTTPLPGTSTPTDPGPTTTVASQFIDPCVVGGAAATGCWGAAGQVDASEAGTADSGDDTGGAGGLAPLTLSYPFAAAGGFADMCDTIERGSVPDPLLPPAARPTVAVLVNQPSSLALTATWADGTPVEKRTMLTLPEHDAAWTEAWEASGTQGRVLACLTLPLDEVRARAAGGRAQLTVDIIAISAGGRAEIEGMVALEVPLDGDDTPFVDGFSVRHLGEQLQPDGRRAAAVAVHYAILDDAKVPAGSTLEAASTTVHALHAFVENADCAGWALNQQGVDRTMQAGTTVRQEQRTVGGRQRAVTVVDSVVLLDPNVRGGWEGFLCLHLRASDRTEATATLALRGVAVRAPRTALYEVGVQMAGLPEGWQVEVAWAGADGTVWCGPARFGDPSAVDGASPAGALCTTLARLHPGGITLVVTPIGPPGTSAAPLTVRVPVNAAYCNPDDRFAAIADGCTTGFTHTLQVTIGEATGDDSPVAATVTLTVVRTASPGQLLTSPAHGWRIDPPQSFA